MPLQMHEKLALVRGRSSMKARWVRMSIGLSHLTLNRCWRRLITSSGCYFLFLTQLYLVECIFLTIASVKTRWVFLASLLELILDPSLLLLFWNINGIG